MAVAVILRDPEFSCPTGKLGVLTDLAETPPRPPFTAVTMSAHAKAAGAAAYSLQNWSEAADKFSEAIDAVAGC